MIIKNGFDAGSALTDFHSTDKAEIAGYLRKSTTPEDIWIQGKTEYPSLAVLTNGDSACLHYFESEGQMWQSYGTHTKKVTFLAGGEEWEAPAYTVISLESAILCINVFFDTHKRPECIAWQEI